VSSFTVYISAFAYCSKLRDSRKKDISVGKISRIMDFYSEGFQYFTTLTFDV